MRICIDGDRYPRVGRESAHLRGLLRGAHHEVLTIPEVADWNHSRVIVQADVRQAHQERGTQQFLRSRLPQDLVSGGWFIALIGIRLLGQFEAPAEKSSAYAFRTVGVRSHGPNGHGDKPSG
jgi:hypothetical protein